jgi:hypothetical protein
MSWTNLSAVMPGLVPGIHVLTTSMQARVVRIDEALSLRAVSLPSCPRLSRASTSSLTIFKNTKDVDGRNKSGHDAAVKFGASIDRMTRPWARRKLNAATTVAILHRVRTEVPFFVFAQTAVVRAQVFMRSAP